MTNDNSVDKNTKAPITGTGGGSTARGSESLGLDLQLMSGPWSVLVEWFRRNEERVALASQRDSSSTVQVGYFIVPDAWELVARVSRVNADAVNAAPTAGVLPNTDARETTLGLNRDLDGHNSKWMFDVVRNDFRNHTNADDLDNTQYRVQYQAIF